MTGITVNPAAGRIGAEIEGVDISRPLDADQISTIQQALDEWKVVIFRNQQLDHATQIAFGRQFGELTYGHPHHEPPKDAPEIYTIQHRRFEKQLGGDATRELRKYAYAGNNGWHSDLTPFINPPAGAILRAEVLPNYGGDTQYTNLVAAYDGLSEPFKEFVDGLRAEHRYGANWSGMPQPSVAGFQKRVEENALVSHHPLVRVHPRTGQKALFVNPIYTDHIVGLSPIESRLVLGYLFDEIARPEYTVRFRWAPGSVIFWDNRATCHIPPRDLDHLDVERVLHRVTLVGEVPVGPDGRESEALEGPRLGSEPVFNSTFFDRRDRAAKEQMA
ncbi:alpha-ketoglutarate-dependent taurine dioxygenase [Kitasatospora sp. MAA19]|uniref:TauD/TfdA dioxygenase family protein n=1 Tax=unclassified Kitasatospora TaxID=2633591 RepID=UPI0024766986|nr:TauD/TfdA family dioxygenase [Kitasatospora sp. MAA19]MDH6707197.1 alpha-ketoglutarate-dependent taurine dioxygenase [Kitasatospora sp. MAA19]